MGNISKANLLDKDIKLLAPKANRYLVAVGNPKELYIWVNPNGIKSFCVRVDENGKKKHIKIKEFREGIYSVAEARKDATKLLKELESGKDIATIKGKNDKYLFKNLFELYYAQKEKNGVSAGTLQHIRSRFERFLRGSLGDKDAKNIKYSDLLAICNAIFNPSEQSSSRLETTHRTISDLKGIFSIALKDRYIDFDPCFGLSSEFPSTAKYNLINQNDTRMPSITDEITLKAFINDLKSNKTIDPQTKRAIYLQILCVNRPINTAEAKWADIDLEKKTWDICGAEMKQHLPHQIALSDYAIKILSEQKLFSGDKNFVFPASNKDGHLHRDTIGKAIRNLGSKGKYAGIATSHGFRATFKTICSEHEAELMQIGIGEKIVEECLSHKERNQVRFAYERSKATFEKKLILMQWYGDYLNSIEPLF